MSDRAESATAGIEQRLREAEATIDALLSGQVDAVVDPRSKTPVLLTKAQDALRESEERFRRIVETANEGICTLDTRATITFANARIAEMLGFEVGELLGRSLFSVLPESSHERARVGIEGARNGASGENETRLLRKDGSSAWALVKTSPVLSAEGRYAGILAMVTDRTRYRAAEESLRSSEEQYRQIVETTNDGIIKLDEESRIAFTNRRFAEMLGYEPRELIGMSVFDLVSDGAREAVAASIEKRRQGVMSEIDKTFRHRNGTDILVNVAGSPLVDGAGRYTGSLGVVRDVTEQRKLQSQLMVSDRMASVGTLAAGVAHEINNPLAAVIANLDYIAESLGRVGRDDDASASHEKTAAWFLEEMKSPLRDAREAAGRVRFIVRDLKVFSRSPAEDPLGPVDVKAILETSLRMAWNEVRHRAKLVRILENVPAVDANGARLGQVFLNLIVNAAQALPEGQAAANKIEVRTRLEGGRVLIEVSDTGPGIPPAIIGRIFDAFFTTKTVGAGTGLGLAICQRIVTDMGGELTVASQIGKGTTFRVSLPASGSEPVAPAEASSVAVAGRRGRILIVDDEEVVLRILKLILSKEHEVVATVSAREALALSSAGEIFDLILCDLMMPEMTGMDLHRELSRIAPEQANRMIFLTGGAFTAKAQLFLSETPKEHIEKPFDSGNLRAIVQRHLRQKA